MALRGFGGKMTVGSRYGILKIEVQVGEIVLIASNYLLTAWRIVHSEMEVSIEPDTTCKPGEGITAEKGAP